MSQRHQWKSSYVIPPEFVRLISGVIPNITENRYMWDFEGNCNPSWKLWPDNNAIMVDEHPTLVFISKRKQEYIFK